MTKTAERIVSRLGIQSWCFRGLKGGHEGLIRALRECDVRNLEICGIHLNPVEADRAGLSQALAPYTAAGITISAFGTHGFHDNADEARRVFEFAALSGFPAITADAWPGSKWMDVVEALCAEYGKRVAIHNHGRKHWLGSVMQLDDVFRRTSANVGLCLDTGWMLDSGENPLEVARKFRDRLYGVHIKDFVFDRSGKPEDVVTGTGNLDLDALTSFLVEIDFGGYLTIEFEGDEHDPVPSLKRCVAAVRAAFAKV